MIVYGNLIIGTINNTEAQWYQLPDGYTIKSMNLTGAELCGLNDEGANSFGSGDFTFPIVNGYSPSGLYLSGTKNNVFKIKIYEFGLKPSHTYFDGAFTPILVNDMDDEYNIIPSDQFK